MSGGLDAKEFGAILDVKLMLGGSRRAKIELCRACWGGFWWSGGPHGTLGDHFGALVDPSMGLEGSQGPKV